jgi:hypothetical protein
MVDTRTGTAFVTMQRLAHGQPQGVGTLLMLDGVHGTLLHRSTVGSSPQLLVLNSALGRVIVVTSRCAAGHVSSCRSIGQSVSVLDARSGAVLWTRPLGVTSRVFQGSRAFLPDEALLAGPQGRRVILLGATGVRVLNLTTRSISAWVPLPGVASAAATDDQSGHIVVFTSDWNLKTLQGLLRCAVEKGDLVAV